MSSGSTSIPRAWSAVVSGLPSSLREQVAEFVALHSLQRRLAKNASPETITAIGLCNSCFEFRQRVGGQVACVFLFTGDDEYARTVGDRRVVEQDLASNNSSSGDTHSRRSAAAGGAGGVVEPRASGGTEASATIDFNNDSRYYSPHDSRIRLCRHPSHV